MRKAKSECHFHAKQSPKGQRVTYTLWKITVTQVGFLSVVVEKKEGEGHMVGFRWTIKNGWKVKTVLPLITPHHVAKFSNSCNFLSSNQSAT